MTELRFSMWTNPFCRSGLNITLEPGQELFPGILRRGWVIAAAPIVEESMVAIRVDDLGINFSVFLHGCFDRRNPLVDARIAFAIDGLDSSLDVGHIAHLRMRAVKRHRRF